MEASIEVTPDILEGLKDISKSYQEIIQQLDDVDQGKIEQQELKDKLERQWEQQYHEREKQRQERLRDQEQRQAQLERCLQDARNTPIPKICGLKAQKKSEETNIKSSAADSTPRLQGSSDTNVGSVVAKLGVSKLAEKPPTQQQTHSDSDTYSKRHTKHKYKPDKSSKDEQSEKDNKQNKRVNTKQPLVHATDVAGSSPDLTSLSAGFRECFELSESQQQYAGHLRRVTTNVRQDNRLCERFDVRANAGNVYKSQRRLSTDDDTGSGTSVGAVKKSSSSVSKQPQKVKSETANTGVKKHSDTKHVVKSKPSKPHKSTVINEKPQERKQEDRKVGRVAGREVGRQVVNPVAGPQRKPLKMTMIFNPLTQDLEVIEGKEIFKEFLGNTKALIQGTQDLDPAVMEVSMAHLDSLINDKTEDIKDPAMVRRKIREAQARGCLVTEQEFPADFPFEAMREGTQMIQAQGGMTAVMNTPEFQEFMRQFGGEELQQAITLPWMQLTGGDPSSVSQRPIDKPKTGSAASKPSLKHGSSTKTSMEKSKAAASKQSVKPGTTISSSVEQVGTADKKSADKKSSASSSKTNGKANSAEGKFTGEGDAASGKSAGETDSTEKRSVKQLGAIPKQTKPPTVSSLHTQPESRSVAGVSVATGEVEEMKHVERVYINEAIWSEYANEEIKKAGPCKDIRENGMDTIFCLDLSESMKGAGFKQAVAFIRGFIEGIQSRSLDNRFEHVALVTFGCETKVQQHLTCDYFEILRKLDRLTPAGPSPMFAGLTMAWAAILGAGQVFVENGFKMYPRIYILSDGQITPSNFIAGPDQCSRTEYDVECEKILNLTRKLRSQLEVTMYPVPTGSFDLKMLEKIAGATEGKVVSPEDWQAQSSTFKNYLKATRMDMLRLGGGLGGLGELGGLEGLEGLHRMFMDAVLSDSDPQDKEQIMEFLKKHKKEGKTSKTEEKENLPHLGTRVRKNPECAEDARDVVGTITAHLADDAVGVTWDRPDSDGKEREKLQYIKGVLEEVVLVDEPRILGDEMIACGCRVRRGADWNMKYGDQDGGAGGHGSITEVNQTGWVQVRWDNKHINNYRFGAEGRFDLEIIPPDVKPADIKAPKGAESLQEPKLEGAEAAAMTDVERMNLRNIEEMNKKNASISGTVIRNDQSLDTMRSQVLRSTTPASGSAGQRTEFRPVPIIDSVQTIPQDTIRQGGVQALNATRRGDSSSRSSIPGSQQGRSSLTTAPVSGTSEAQPQQATATFRKTMTVWAVRSGDDWTPYPLDICETIEKAHSRKPTGSVLISHNGQQYRIVFSRMEQVNTSTKEIQPVRKMHKTC